MSANIQSATTAPSGEEQFVDRIARTLDAGAVSVMLSVGHRLGLFDTLAGLPPSTCARIAEVASLSERYVREWLAVMVVAEIVMYEPLAKTYRFPAEHAACLIREAPLGNLAVYAQFVSMAGSMQDRVVECFETGEGLSYDDYPCFHQVMAEDSAQTVVANIDALIAGLAPEFAARLDEGIDVLDAGCGAGRALAALAKRFPKSRFNGYDLCADAVGMAEQHATSLDLGNLEFRVVDLFDWDEKGAFDLITSFDAVHDTRDPQQVLKSVYRALRPAGLHLMQDIGGSAYVENNIDFPFAAFLYSVSTVHCTPVSLAQGGEALGTMWGWETAQRMLRAAGFERTERYVLPYDPMNVWFVSSKGI